MHRARSASLSLRARVGYPWASLTLLLFALASGCNRDRSACPSCGTVVIAATREPAHILPPLVMETVGRDLGDRVWERLANYVPGGATIDPASYRPGLASRWDRVDSLSWRFRLRPGARWHDGRPVTAADVVFSFGAYTDTLLGAPAGPALDGVTVTAEDSATVLVRFPRVQPEQLYDATWFVRIIPEHLWGSVPRTGWAADTSTARLVGSGPYRVRAWQRGSAVTLDADSAAVPATQVQRLVWRFAPDPEAALNLVLAHEADVLETTVGPTQRNRAAGDTSVRVQPYPAVVYGFVAFRLSDARGRPHPALGSVPVRRALAMATDRTTLAQAIYGAGAVAPRGPFSALAWINDPAIQVLPFDTAMARRALVAAGLSPAGTRGTLKFDILVPSTSPARRMLAEALQAQWRPLGIEATITAVDFPVFQQRLAQGQFDAYIGAYADEPSPRGLTEQWTKAGWGGLNYGRYGNPAFDSLVALASATAELPRARERWREAMDTLNADVPAIFLYSPEQAAVLSRRLENVSIDPFSWLSGVHAWGIDQRSTVQHGGKGAAQ